MSGLLMQPPSAAGLYGVRGSDPNRLRGLENPADKTGFSDPVYLTVCPYLARRPARTLSGSSAGRTLAGAVRQSPVFLVPSPTSALSGNHADH